MKLGDLYVGVIDLFAILLPGALLAGALAVLIPIPEPLQGLLASEGARWVAFAFAAYALGHFAFLLSAKADDWYYDKYRKKKWPKADDPERPYPLATRLRQAQFSNGANPEDNLPMTTFKWAKTVLMLRAPDALADVQRYEADSKFFRSMMVVLPLVGFIGALIDMWPLVPVAILLTWLSFRSYAERRYKSTEWAYQYALVLEKLGGLDRRADQGEPE